MVARGNYHFWCLHIAREKVATLKERKGLILDEITTELFAAWMRICYKENFHLRDVPHVDDGGFSIPIVHKSETP